MSRIDDLIAEHCPYGVEYREIGRVGSLARGKRFVKADMVSSGVPCLHYGEIYTKYGITATQAYSFVTPERAHSLRFSEPGEVIMASAGETIEDIGKAVAWLGDEPIAIHDACYAFSSTMDPKFVSFYFSSRAFRDQIRRHISSGKISSISTRAVAKARIPVPPLAVQREIAAILEKMERLEAELKAEREVRTRQYAHFCSGLLARASENALRLVSMVNIVDEIRSGQNKARAGVGSYVVYGSTGPIGYCEEPKYSGPSLLVARVGANAGRVTAVDGEFDVSDNTIIIRPAEAWDLRFAFHQLTHLNLNQFAVGGGQPLITGTQLKHLTIPLPSLGEQRRVAGILDRFDALVNDLSSGLPAEIQARRKQYEHYRDMLLTFEEKTA